MSETKQKTGRVELPTGVEELTRRVAAIEKNFALMVIDLSEEDRRRPANTNLWLLLIYVAFLAGIFVGRRDHEERRR